MGGKKYVKYIRSNANTLDQRRDHFTYLPLCLQQLGRFVPRCGIACYIIYVEELRRTISLFDFTCFWNNWFKGLGGFEKLWYYEKLEQKTCSSVGKLDQRAAISRSPGVALARFDYRYKLYSDRLEITLITRKNNTKKVLREEGKSLDGKI